MNTSLVEEITSEIPPVVKINEKEKLLEKIETIQRKMEIQKIKDGCNEYLRCIKNFTAIIYKINRLELDIDTEEIHAIEKNIYRKAVAYIAKFSFINISIPIVSYSIFSGLAEFAQDKTFTITMMIIVQILTIFLKNLIYDDVKYNCSKLPNAFGVISHHKDYLEYHKNIQPPNPAKSGSYDIHPIHNEVVF